MKVKKAQAGKKVPKGMVESEMHPGKMIPKSKSNYETGKSIGPAKKVVKKAKSGGSFPDLNKDGKVTKKDVLIGRGVLPKTAKKGAKMAKSGCKACWGTKMKKK